MSRWLAGTFDPRGTGGQPRLPATLGLRAAGSLTLGGLSVSYSGPAPDSLAPLCLLDGFVDNASELATELGLSTEVSSAERLLALAYRRLGRDLPARLRGDFALLIWDQELAEGMLVRDQLGVRSLFVSEMSGRLTFASEIRDLLTLLPQRPSPDSVGIAHWVTTSGRPGTGTLYEGIRRLNPGSMLMLDRNGIREQQYWKPTYTHPTSTSEIDRIESVRGALTQGVRRRLSRQGLTGVLMSGGLDSSSVAAAAAQALPGELLAYSAEFPDHPAVDESALIAELRQTLGIGGVSAAVRAGGLLAGTLEWIETWKMPLTSWGEFWCGPLLAAASSAGVRTVLGGDGGDELFGCRAYLMADRLRRGHPLQTVQLARELPGAGDRPSRRAILREVREFGLMGALPTRLHEFLRKTSERNQPPGWLRIDVSRELEASLDPLAWKRLDGPRWWAFDAHVLTRGVEQLGLFENHRRRAATLGLESRHPLFDLDLLELSLRQPPMASFDRFRDRPLLRASMQGMLPDTVRLRPTKALFDSLLIDSVTGPDGATIRGLLSDPHAELGAYLDMGALQHSLLDSPPDGAINAFRWTYQVWRLLTAECWLRSQSDSASKLLARLPMSTPDVSLRAV